VIPVITIFTYTAGKMPFLLRYTLQHNTPEHPLANSYIFMYRQIFNVNIGGMIVIMYFISLYFDLVESEDYDSNMNRFHYVAQLRAKIISKCLAYRSNEIKFKEMIYVKE
jgi:hypothetical protein